MLKSTEGVFLLSLYEKKASQKRGFKEHINP
ncbi:hypothetical protein CTLINITIAL_04950 [Chlamydia trachomatis L2/434/Bu(i)]|nr:hypothetical protein CTLINITIAL_04950 [Chlamydia trachomatis L2/434/Bu(i)]AGO32830.1 hypothetical protein CTLFINAL_04950 [Chlamydia trachomatis L2/434/Bu(f)]AGR96866.1 hypothetical protein CTRC943_03290 [Chlamydia trachomatis RC-J/943]AGR98707.1 hypothetical protein CTRC3_03330 [Chlamydia trachomatis RC-L2(s)/3]AGS04327.1 hypothetical protein CTRC55_03300 [Chlamydia trachomatis RC-L2/55]